MNTTAYAAEMNRARRRQVTRQPTQRERWTHTLSFALAMFAAYLLVPVSFVAALMASSAVACLYLVALAWRRRTLMRDVGRSEPAITESKPDAEGTSTRPSFRREFPHAFVY